MLVPVWAMPSVVATLRIHVDLWSTQPSIDHFVITATKQEPSTIHSPMLPSALAEQNRMTLRCIMLSPESLAQSLRLRKCTAGTSSRNYGGCSATGAA